MGKKNEWVVFISWTVITWQFFNLFVLIHGYLAYTGLHRKRRMKKVTTLVYYIKNYHCVSVVNSLGSLSCEENGEGAFVFMLLKFPVPPFPHNNWGNFVLIWKPVHTGFNELFVFLL